jgi:hypothetical protein
LNYTKGMVTSMEHTATFTTDAYADNGFLGGPVFNLQMEIVGMVKGGIGFMQGINNQQVRCTGMAKVETGVSLMMHAFPGCGNWP